MEHLSDLQQSCTNLSSETELVAGEIYGMRQWTFRNAYGTGSMGLWGHWDFSWNIEGVNEAVCEKDFEFVDAGTIPIFRVGRNGTRAEVQAAVRTRVQRAFNENPGAISVKIQGTTAEFYAADSFLQRERACWDTAEDVQRLSYILVTPTLLVQALVPRTKHQIAAPECACGFYAYTNGESLSQNSYTGGHCVLGIVRCWGLATVGTKGFRAQYAQIVGLTVPLRGEYSWAERGKVWHLTPETPEYRDIIPATMPRYAGVDSLLARYKELTAQ